MKFPFVRLLNALSSLTSGVDNSAFGYNALSSLTNGNFNTATGFNSLRVNTGDSNTAMGFSSLSQNTSGVSNTGVGFFSLLNNTTGFQNTGVGYAAMQTNTGSNNTGVGFFSLFSKTTGDGNSGFGNLAGNAITSGGTNTMLGSTSGSSFPKTGSSNTFVGYNTNSTIECSGSTALGAGATVSGSNQIVLGTISEFTKIPGRIAISPTSGTSSSSGLDINWNTTSGTGYTDFLNYSESGGGGFTFNTVGITNTFLRIATISRANITAPAFNATSDYRIKENVKTLDDSFNIDLLRPVHYMNKLTKKMDIGLIAHEVQEHYPDLVSGEKDGDDLQSMNYIGFIGILIKEIQTSKKKITSMEQTIVEIKQDNQDLHTELDFMKKQIIEIQQKIGMV